MLSLKKNALKKTTATKITLVRPSLWSRKAPKEVGFYWWRPPQPADVRLIATYSDGGKIMAGGYDLPVGEMHGYWSGPLIKPPIWVEKRSTGNKRQITRKRKP